MATVEIVAFVFGGFLLLVAILGGGFEVRELKVPRVGWTSRMMSSLFGVVFIVVGLTQGHAGPGAPADPEIEIVEESADVAEPYAARAEVQKIEGIEEPALQ